MKAKKDEEWNDKWDWNNEFKEWKRIINEIMIIER